MDDSILNRRTDDVALRLAELERQHKAARVDAGAIADKKLETLRRVLEDRRVPFEEPPEAWLYQPGFVQAFVQELPEARRTVPFTRYVREDKSREADLERENEHLRRVIKDGLRFGIIAPRSRGDRAYQALKEAVE